MQKKQGFKSKWAIMKDDFNGEVVDNSLKELARLLAREKAECDIENYIQSLNTKPKDGP